MDNKIAEPRIDDLEILKEYTEKGKLEKGFFPLASYDMVQSGYPTPTEGLMVQRCWGGTNGKGELLSGRGMWCKVDDVKALLAEGKETTKSSGLNLHGVIPELPIEKIIGQTEAWPLVDVLKKLTEASEILLHRKNYDGHGWEEIAKCVERAKQITSLLNGN
jgi:hypothetical protein